MIRTIVTLVALIAVVLIGLAVGRHLDREEPVHVEARATTTTMWPTERVPDLGASFDRLVTAMRPKPRPRARARTAPTRHAAAGVVFPTDELLYRLAMCETGGTMNQRIVSNTRPPYFSFFQWALSTWRSVGGVGDPRDASYETQLPLVRKLILRSGWRGQFPRCSRAIGVA